jgi:hypothetical protein
MAFGSSHTTQRDQIFNTIKFMGTKFMGKPSFFHSKSHNCSSSFVRVSGQNINLDLLYDKNMLNKKQKMQICNNKSINSSYLCTHYCQCYFQIYVTCRKQ